MFIANTEGYSARAGVSWATGSRSTNVHNSYLLVAVETGYLGFVTMIALLCSAMWSAFATAIRFRRQPGAEVLIGVGYSILAMSLQGLYEWMFVSLPAQSLLAVSFGLIAGLRSRFNLSRYRGTRTNAFERQRDLPGHATIASGDVSA